jgi:proteasome lid subunit RPN8/RPN11
MVLRIKKEHLDEIVQFARKCYPMEACGILVGKIGGGEKVVCKVYHTKNVLASPFAYQIDPQEQLRLFEEAENQGLEILGFYHSHPFWDSFWSKTDEQASKYWNGFSFLIVSFKTGNINSYLKRQDKAEREEVVTI